MTDRSSTSSSRTRAPVHAATPLWAVALLLAAVLTAVWTVGWRSAGFQSVQPNSAAHWAPAFAGLGRDEVAVVGTSRAQAAVDPEAWAAVWPERPARNLAILGSPPQLVLERLADEGFDGIVVAGLARYFVFNTAFEPVAARQALAQLDEFRRSPFQRWEHALRDLAPSWAPLHHPALDVRSPLLALVGRPPRLPRFEMRSDRFLRFYADRLPADLAPEYERFREEGTPATDAERDAETARLKRSVDRIEANGGRVLFVRFPTCGERDRIEEERYPMARYLDPVREGLGAPLLEPDGAWLDGWTYTCADGSHLGTEDAATFTGFLAAEVRRWAAE